MAAIVVVVSLAIQVSWYYLGSTDGRALQADRHTEIRVFASNIFKGQADPRRSSGSPPTTLTSSRWRS